MPIADQAVIYNSESTNLERLKSCKTWAVPVFNRRNFIDFYTAECRFPSIFSRASFCLAFDVTLIFLLCRFTFRAR